MLCLNPDGCDTELVIDETDDASGVCAKCGFDNNVIIRRYKYERAFKNYEKQMDGEPVPDKKDEPEKKEERRKRIKPPVDNPFGIV